MDTNLEIDRRTRRASPLRPAIDGARARGSRALTLSPPRAVQALACMLVISGAGCVGPLDRSVPRDAFRGSREALERATARAAQSTPGPVRVGWGEAEIAAVPGVSLAGYGSRAGVPHEGVHDPLHARALAVSAGQDAPVVFLALDLLLVSRDLRDAMEARLAGVIPIERMILTASHTHGGLGGYTRGFTYSLVLGGFDPRAEGAILDAIEAAVRDALAALEPGRVVLGEVEIPGLGSNRVRARGLPVDPVAGVLLAERTRDGARAALVSYAAHATTVSDLDLQITADYPGVLARSLRRRGLAWAAFAAGAVGSMSPRAGWSEQPGATWTGEAMAEGVAAAIPRLAAHLEDNIAVAALATTLVLPEAQWRLGDEWVVTSPLASWFAPKRAPVVAVSFGRATWVALPLELSGEIAARIRARARRTGRTLVVSAFGGDYAGYVVPEAAYDLPDDEKGDMADYETHLMSFYGPHMGALAAAAAWRTMRAAESLTGEACAARAPLIRVAGPSTSPPPEPPRPDETPRTGPK